MGGEGGNGFLPTLCVIPDNCVEHRNKGKSQDTGLCWKLSVAQ
jgi:hypothetical protein